MKIVGLCIISIIFIIGTSQIAYCPNPGSVDSGSYKGGSYGGMGDKIKTDAPAYSTTLGQELIDLKKAFKKGIINEQEYNELKKIIIEQRTQIDK